MIVLLFHLFSRDEATLYKGVSVRPLVGQSVSPSVMLLLFGPQGATYGRVSGLVSIVSYEMALRDFGSMGKNGRSLEIPWSKGPLYTKNR